MNNEPTKRRRVTSSPINRAAVKTIVLGMADARWHGHYGTRVSDEFYRWLEDIVRLKIAYAVAGSPSKGKTIYPPIRAKDVQE